MNLDNIALEIRQKTIKSLFHAQSGHPGPSMSIVEMLTTLYFKEMNCDGPLRDRFILSKGHAAPSYYAALVVKGLMDEKLLDTLRDIGSALEGHPVKTRLPELVDASTGSLGQGFSNGIGYALAMKLKKQFDRRVYVIIGDGESQEGQIWEAAMCAPKFKLDNLLVIVDYNKYQNDGPVSEQMPLDPLADKWRAFNWNVQELADGHDMNALLAAYKNARETKGKPSVIIAHTIKGKGISFMEGGMSWHSRAIKADEYEQAISELAAKMN